MGFLFNELGECLAQLLGCRCSFYLEQQGQDRSKVISICVLQSEGRTVGVAAGWCRQGHGYFNFFTGGNRLGQVNSCWRKGFYGSPVVRSPPVHKVVGGTPRALTGVLDSPCFNELLSW